MMNREQAIAYGRHIGVRYHIYNSHLLQANMPSCVAPLITEVSTMKNENFRKLQEMRMSVFADAYLEQIEHPETYEAMTFDERLAVMDSTAATLCRDNGLPILVFDLGEPANIAKALQGEVVGTLVKE